MPQKRKRQARRNQLAANAAPRLMTRTVPVRVAAAAGEGSAPRTFELAAYTGEPMDIWPFEHPVIVDLQSMDLSVQSVPALYDHAPWMGDVVGQVDKQEVKGGQLVVGGRFTIDPKLPHERNTAAQVLAKADAGYQWQVSIGGNPKSLDEVQAGATVNVNGRDYPGPCFVARGVSLREVSFVVLGGDRRTRAVVARGMEASAMSFEQWLLTLGFEDPAALSEVQKANLMQKYQAEYPDGDTANAAAETPAETEEETPPANAAAKKPKVQAQRAAADQLAARRREEAAEVTRTNEIKRLCAAANNPVMTTGTGTAERTIDIAAHAIAEGWTVDNTRREIELQQLRASRTPAPAVFSHSKDRDVTLQAMQAALLLRAGGKLDYKFRRPLAAVALRLPAWLRAGVNDADRNKIMDSAHHYSGMSAVDICAEACRLDGIDAPRERFDLIRAAIAGPRIQAASSGSALVNIFSTSVNAMLLMAYEQSEDTSAAWTQEEDVGNFQTQERPRIDIGEGLKKTPRGKQAEHRKYADSVESYKIARYTGMFEVDEIDLIDDNLSGLDSVPGDMGKAGARLRPDLCYAILLDNPTLNATSRALFNTTDGNLAGSGTALATATLTTGIKAMALFRENSVNLNLQPTHLLVPPSLELTAYELTQSPQILYGADDETVRGNLNAIKVKGITPVPEARLENGLVDPNTGDSESGSATAWYLASTQAHTIIVGYLRGTGRAPRVRSYVLDKGKWGMGWDVELSIGAKAMDWKGLYKNAGA